LKQEIEAQCIKGLVLYPAN